jgi:hypothetical protein
MTIELTQFTISEVSPAYWQVSLSHPAINSLLLGNGVS